MEPDPPQRILGLDVGEQRIGVAVSEGTLAVPLTIINHKNRDADIARVLRLAEEQRVGGIVIGMPYAPDGGEGEQARRTRRFGDDLSARTDVPIVYEDERLSSADVAGARRSRGKRKVHIDDLAAAVILQRHLDTRQRS